LLKYLKLVLRDRQEPLGQSGRHVAPLKREESLATHTLVQDDGVLAVGDTQADPRFAETETIQSAGIVPYLGAVVKAPAGTVVGVLSVYDDQPRNFCQAEQEYLERLAYLSGDLVALEAGGDLE
jgi:signal transduction protein with GAF and PtsI domain